MLLPHYPSCLTGLKTWLIVDCPDKEKLKPNSPRQGKTLKVSDAFFPANNSFKRFCNRIASQTSQAC